MTENVKDILVTGGIYLGVSAIVDSLRRPSKKQLKELRDKAERKRALCTSHYWKGGHHFAEYSSKGVSWTEEIKEDPFGLYE